MSSSHFRSSLLLATTLVLAAGCNVIPSPQADPTRFYVLASPSPAAPGIVAKLKRINLRPVEVASYLRSRPMVVRRGDNEVQFRDFARWGEPLEQGVGRVLRDALLASGAAGSVSVASSRVGRVAGEPDLLVNVQACEGGADGSVRFEAAWELLSGSDGSVVSRGNFKADGLKWDGRQEASIAAAVSQGVVALAAEITAAVGAVRN
jgi:uncharacterized lipoprotein YmbA